MGCLRHFLRPDVTGWRKSTSERRNATDAMSSTQSYRITAVSSHGLVDEPTQEWQPDEDEMIGPFWVFPLETM